VQRLLASGLIEMSEDKATGLCILSYKSNAPTVERWARVCCGFVLHPFSATVVATTFVRFFDAAPAECVPVDGDTLLTSTPKVDGSMVVAFKWAGVLQTCTRRRMDSEQAVWAREWLNERIGEEGLKKGWTYVFEAMYDANMVVVCHPFKQVCVLLSVVDSGGRELSHPTRQEEALRLRIPTVSPVTAMMRELQRSLYEGGGDSDSNGAIKENVLERSAALTMEG
jgi:hypothetical protein